MITRDNRIKFVQKSVSSLMEVHYQTQKPGRPDLDLTNMNTGQNYSHCFLSFSNHRVNRAGISQEYKAFNEQQKRCNILCIPP